jgi:uncharacterized protein YecT (DUF1311 family)
MKFHKLSTLLLFVALAGASQASWSSGVPRDPIDVQYDAAMEKDPSTVGMKMAAYDARLKWDKEMNKSYAHLMAGANHEQKEALKASQRAWLKFRDAEVDSTLKIIGVQAGSVWLLTATTHQMEVIRTRALQLREYEEALSEQN